MKPIENPWKVERPEQLKKVSEEINLFLESEAEYAEMWSDDSVSVERNVERYKNEWRRMRIKTGQVVTFHQHKGAVIAVREDKIKGKAWRSIK